MPERPDVGGPIINGVTTDMSPAPACAVFDTQTISDPGASTFSLNCIAPSPSEGIFSTTMSIKKFSPGLTLVAEGITFMSAAWDTPVEQSKIIIAARM